MSGNFYQQGIVVAQDYAEAMRWFRLAADHQETRAHKLMSGTLYEKGWGRPTELRRSNALAYRMAAEQNEATAQNNIGVLYENGHGIIQDYGEGKTLVPQGR